jgi:lysine 6-dehydrogenase
LAFVYAIIGTGRQGTAAAYDLALRGRASEIRLLDADAGRVASAARRLRALLASKPGAPACPVLKAVPCDVRDGRALAGVLAGSHAALSGLPYHLNVGAARAAIEARCHFNDLGGNTAVVRETLALDKEARRAGVSIVPDCGLAPGMCQTLAVYAMSRIENPRHVRIRCGGLPQVPRPPLGYRIVFSVAGLTNEYTGTAVCLRKGRVTELPAFTEPEEIEFPMPVGKCEAFLTSGGTSTAPWTFARKIETYDYKTVRYKGHYDRVRCLIDLGFLETEPVLLPTGKVVPRELTHELFERHLAFPEDMDLVVLRVECFGDARKRRAKAGAKTGRASAERVTAPRRGKLARPALRGRSPFAAARDNTPAYRIDLLDFHDVETGFTAMERTTAFPAAIVTSMQAAGTVKPGARPVETAVPAEPFVRLLDRRGFKVVHARL